jgi:hypothetical protein
MSEEPKIPQIVAKSEETLEQKNKRLTDALEEARYRFNDFSNRLPKEAMIRVTLKHPNGQIEIINDLLFYRIRDDSLEMFSTDDKGEPLRSIKPIPWSELENVELQSK